MRVAWGDPSAGTEPPQSPPPQGDDSQPVTPQPLWVCWDKQEGATPPRTMRPVLFGGGLHKGCSRCRGGQGTRVPVSQLRPNHQLPQSSCRFVRIRPPQPQKTHWEPPQGFVPLWPSTVPNLPGPACPQLPWGKMFSPPTQVGPHGAGFCCPSRQRGAGRDWDTTGKGPGCSQDRHWAMLGTGAKTRWLGTRALGHGQARGQRP